MIGCSDLLVKVCGMTRQEDVDLCAQLSVQFAGFIFHPGSPRYVTPEHVRSIKTRSMMRVGVFVNQSLDETRAIMEQAGLHLAQLHGEQDPEFCRQLGRDNVIKAFWPARYKTQDELVQEINRFKDHIRLCLFDAGTSGGGHGTTMDLSLLKDLKIDKTWFLAGGLGPDNLVEVLREAVPCGVDLNSGLESAPGIKDHDKIRSVMGHICGQRILERI